MPPNNNATSNSQNANYMELYSNLKIKVNNHQQSRKNCTLFHISEYQNLLMQRKDFYWNYAFVKIPLTLIFYICLLWILFQTRDVYPFSIVVNNAGKTIITRNHGFIIYALGMMCLPAFLFFCSYDALLVFYRKVKNVNELTFDEVMPGC